MKEELRNLSIQMAVMGERMDARFEQIDARFEQIDARFEQIDSRIDRVEGLMVAGFKEMKEIIADNHAALISAVMKR